MADENETQSPDNVESSDTPSPEMNDNVADESAASPPEEAAAPVKDGGDPDAGSSEASEPDQAPASEPGATPSADEIMAEAGSVEEDSSASGDDFKVVNKEDVGEEDAEAAMLAMLEELPEDGSGATPDDINFGSASVSKAEFQQLSEPAGKPEIQNIDMLLDINLPVSIELGRTRMSISDILALGPGSVVELNKLAGEPVDLLVNYKTVARGEVVVIDENFGVRITNLISPEERLRTLGEEQ